MAADKQIIADTLNWIFREKSAAIFAIEDHYVQAAAALPSDIYCEAVSHHYHSAIDIGLESKFTELGFHLEEGGNYSRRYYAGNEDSAEKIAADILYIFEEIFRSNPNAPFEVTEL
ncbi:MAG: hypothetical protein J0M37_03365 [Ignavibacteria bacterium]|nr:hypothetical protein [Ignavibacteria bacterium]